MRHSLIHYELVFINHELVLYYATFKYLMNTMDIVLDIFYCL